MADTANPGKKLVEITQGKNKFKFLVGINEFNTFQDMMLPTNKVTPSENFLVACVQGGDEVKEKLITEYFDKGYSFELASLVSAEFKPAMEFTVKK